jgi:predicted dehydrogenase
MDRLRIGVLGTGVIIRDFHMLCLQNHPRAEVVAAANLHAESLGRLVRQFGIPRAYTSFEEMAQDPEIDAVVVGLPNALHAPVTVQMLAAGKHVLCEKPMATSVAEGEQMIAAALRSGKTLMIAHMWRFDREIRWLHDLVVGGRLGRVFKAKSHAIWLYEGPAQGSWFVSPELAGFGSLADMGVHSLDTLRYVLGGARPLKVFSSIGTYLRDIELDDTASLLIEFEGGIHALVEAGWYHLYADGLEGYTQVYGTQGYARAAPSELHSYVEGVWSVTQPKMPQRKIQCDLPMYQAQMDHFIECALAGKEPLTSGPECLWSMRLLEAAYRSARTGQAEEV